MYWDILLKQALRYKDHEILNLLPNKNKSKKKDLKFLKDKKYFYYTYWYPFFFKRKEQRTEFYKAIDLLNLENINDIRAGGLGDSIKYFFWCQPILSKYVKSEVFSTKYSTLMIYYSFNAGLKKTTYMGKNFLEIDEYNILMLDLRYSKPRVFCLDEDRTVSTLTTGIITKILGVKEKNLKKSNRVLNVILKTSFKKLNEKTTKTKTLVYIKGIKFFIYTALNIFRENFNESDMIILFNPYIRRNKIRFKKIKSIKRNLLKKFLKVENRRN